MDFYNKLPRNNREFILFLAVVSTISVNTIAPIVTFLEIGFCMQNWLKVIMALPLLWPSVIVVVLLTHSPAEWLTSKLTKKGDSFRAVLTINILCSVFFISIFLSIIGTWIGTGSITWKPIREFIYLWPRNMVIAFMIEAFLAQPVARQVMVIIHRKSLAKVQMRVHSQDSPGSISN